MVDLFFSIKGKVVRKPYKSKKILYGKGSKGGGLAWVNGKNTKAYATWSRMLERCYCPKRLSKYPTYVNCSVSNEWLFFPTFNTWFDNNYVEGWELDKDLLVAGNKEYGPNTSCFVPQSINKLFTDSGKSRGNYPIGVSLCKPTGKFRAVIRVDSKMKHLGYYSTVEEASQAYLIAKKANVIRMADKWKDKIQTKLYDALIRKAEEL